MPSERIVHGHGTEPRREIPEEVDLPRWILRRYAVIEGGKVHRFEDSGAAVRHWREHGGEVRVLTFRLSEVDVVTPRPITTPAGTQYTLRPPEGAIRTDGE